MYGKCGSLCDASHIFNNMCVHNVFSYTAIISAFIMHEESENAVKVFQLMQGAGLMPDKFIFSHIFKACASIGALAYGRHAHSYLIICGLEPDALVISALIDMYTKCGTFSDSQRVFDNEDEKHISIWTSMVSCYAHQLQREAVLQLFNQLQVEGVQPSSVTYLPILQVCSFPSCLGQCKRVHAYILSSRVECSLALTNTIINMYAKCGSINYAFHVFSMMVKRDVVSWNVMIMAYVEANLIKEALALLENMQKESVTPSQSTHVSLLKGCIQLGDVELGMLVHACIMENFSQVGDFLYGNLVAMYAKCNNLEDAHNILNHMDKPDVVSWTLLIAGYIKIGKGKEALILFQKMKKGGVEPDEVAFINSLKACGGIGALQYGKRIHEDINKSRYHISGTMKNALIEMYIKCGSLKDASDVFASREEQDILSWNLIISGYGQQGKGKQALQYFTQMQEEGMKPDATTFLAVLFACKYAGLVEKGYHYLDFMKREYAIEPAMDHYACMVDILCRAGHIDEAEDFITKMEVKPGAVVWMSLLRGCRCLGQVEIAKHAYTQIIKLNPTLPGAYSTLANIFVTAGMWNDLVKIREEMDSFQFPKQAECTYIEIENEIYMFSMVDRGHSKMKEIQMALSRLSHMMEEAGYQFTMNKMDSMAGDMKEDCSTEHSERLAVAFGLINTSPGTPLRITKNLRICGDCHAAFRFISDSEGREIFARDSSGFHHFKNGTCSCGDYW
ncbi:hypothetical protein KP509_1Z081600 [Ceratopteris richardii]|nr:hypothetical protein KP509_1Z081600 [Ceratopteris richardii]